MVCMEQLHKEGRKEGRKEAYITPAAVRTKTDSLHANSQAILGLTVPDQNFAP